MLLLVPALAALFAAAAGTSFAEPVLDAVGWQSGGAERPPRPVVWRKAERAASGGGKDALLLRGIAELKNRGPKPAEGLLLRYCVSARLVADGAAAQPAWAIPFLIDERRVAKIGPNQVVEIAISLSPKLEHYFKKLRRRGFHADVLKIAAMLEPSLPGGVRVVESSLEVGP